MSIGLTLTGITVDSMIAKHPKSSGKLRVARGYHTAFSSGDVFHGMKAEHCHVADAAHPPASVLRSERMTCILDNDESMAPGQFKNGFEIRWMPRVIHR